MSEKRRHDRVPFHEAITISWSDRQGLLRTVRGRCLDISCSGLSAEVDMAPPLREFVQFMVEQRQNVRGTATVRRSTQRQGRYVIGLEFSGGLKVDPKTLQTAT